jgi:hypothetical protein
MERRDDERPIVATAIMITIWQTCSSVTGRHLV